MSKKWKMEVLDNKTKVRSLIGNRDINQTHVKNIKESMREHGVLSSVTVMKSGKGFILLDGHHRWKAAKELGYSIPAMVVDKESSVAVVALNNVQKNWSLNDYAKYYRTNGDKETKAAYDEIVKYHEETGLNYSCLSFVLGKQQIKHFKEGTFRVNRPAFAKVLFVYLKDIEEYVPFANHARFVSGYVHLASSPIYDQQRMMIKLKNVCNALLNILYKKIWSIRILQTGIKGHMGIQ